MTLSVVAWRGSLVKRKVDPKSTAVDWDGGAFASYGIVNKD